MNLVPLQDGADHLFVNLGEREAHGLGHHNPAGALALEDHVRPLLVQPHTDILKLLFEQRALLRRLGRV